jgi:hypothetical protein
MVAATTTLSGTFIERTFFRTHPDNQYYFVVFQNINEEDHQFEVVESLTGTRQDINPSRTVTDKGAPVEVTQQLINARIGS